MGTVTTDSAYTSFSSCSSVAAVPWPAQSTESKAVQITPAAQAPQHNLAFRSGTCNKVLLVTPCYPLGYHREMSTAPQHGALLKRNAVFP